MAKIKKFSDKEIEILECLVDYKFRDSLKLTTEETMRKIIKIIKRKDNGYI